MADLPRYGRLLRIARPQFLASGLAIFVIGATWAVLLGAPFSLAQTLLGYLVLLPAHLSISYSNDYFDVDVDKFGRPTFFSGGSGVLVDNPDLRRPALWTALALTLCSLALGIGVQIAFAFPPWFAGFVLMGNFLAWFYSAPPLRLSYRGLGELSTLFSVGVLIPGMGYLVTRGRLDPDGFLFTLPLMLYGLAFILTVEIPDLESDRLGSKRTWVARRGRGFGFIAVAACFLLATLFFFIFPQLTARVYPVDLRFVGLLSLLPLGAGCLAAFKRPLERGPATRMVNAIMISVAVFCLLVDGYLLFLASR